MAKRYIAVCLTFGYVESTSLATLMFKNNSKSFGEEAEAIKSLSEDLLAIYRERACPRKTKKKCCEKAKGNFCSTCGKSLSEEDFDVGAFEDWLRGLLSATYDDFGYDDYADGRDITWEITNPGDIGNFHKAKYDVVYVDQKAADTICDALCLDNDY